MDFFPSSRENDLNFYWPVANSGIFSKFSLQSTDSLSKTTASSE